MMSRSNALPDDTEWLIAFALRKYFNHPDYEDLVQEARIQVWRDREKASSRAAKHTTWIVCAARKGAIEYLRTGKGSLFKPATRLKFRPERLISIEETAWGNAGQEDEDGERRDGTLLVEPDFSAELIEKLHRSELGARWLERLRQMVSGSPVERYVDNWISQQKSMRQLSMELGLHPETANTMIHTVFRRLRNLAQWEEEL